MNKPDMGMKPTQVKREPQGDLPLHFSICELTDHSLTHQTQHCPYQAEKYDVVATWVQSEALLAEIEPADAQSKRPRVLIAQKALSNPQPPAIKEEPELQQPCGQAVLDGQHQSAAATQHADKGTHATEGNGMQLKVEDRVKDEKDAWAEDGDARGVPLFDAGAGQDYDHQLKAPQKMKEEQKLGQKLPPGWAKDPNYNAGTETAAPVPIKVLHLPAGHTSQRRTAPPSAPPPAARAASRVHTIHIEKPLCIKPKPQIHMSAVTLPYPSHRHRVITSHGQLRAVSGGCDDVT